MPRLTEAQVLAVMDAGLMHASSVASVSRHARRAIRQGWMPNPAICQRYRLHPYHCRWWRARLKTPSRVAQQNSGLSSALLADLQQSLDAGISPSELEQVHGVPVRYLVLSGALCRLPRACTAPDYPLRMRLLVEAGLASADLAAAMRISQRAARTWIARCRSTT